MKTIYIVRHGETDLNRDGIVQGSGVDAGLNDTGRQQSRAFFEHYRKENFEVVLTSRLRRTHQTMKPFIESGIPWEQFAEINEINWGEHEGKKSTPEMRARYRELLLEWCRGNFGARLNEGESADELAARLKKFVEHLRERPEKKILVCTHGRAMRCLTCLLKEEPLQRMEEYHHSNTGLFIVRLANGQFIFEKENNTRHLEER